MHSEDLGADDVLLVGALYFRDHPFAAGKPPAMKLRVWCPYCKESHTHPWKGEIPIREVYKVPAPCSRGPLRDSWYFVGVAPYAVSANVEKKRAFLERLDEYWREMKSVQARRPEVDPELMALAAEMAEELSAGRRELIRRSAPA